MSTIPIINCSNIYQLSEFVAHMVPKIWCGAPLLSLQQSSNFKLFCQNIFKSTQISTSCILVALFYIYKLRYKYPGIKASIGSEVRLFTTALILANKFLDDNTFTNKVKTQHYASNQSINIHCFFYRLGQKYPAYHYMNSTLWKWNFYLLYNTKRESIIPNSSHGLLNVNTGWHSYSLDQLLLQQQRTQHRQSTE
jgi:hypothetical protein